jgi:hypothetical protein
VGGDLGRHLDALQPIPELRAAVTPEQEQVWMKGLALVVGQAVDEQAFAFAHAVLLTSD